MTTLARREGSGYLRLLSPSYPNEKQSNLDLRLSSQAPAASTDLTVPTASSHVEPLNIR